MEKLLLSKREAAQVLGGISVRTIENMIAAKELKSVLVGRRRMIPMCELERFSRVDHPSAQIRTEATD